ncbi:GNAT family N-acetyltransferase [Candidatus Bathyarchaeota archaeon]|nr:MAG: GNAT family N-acetyltransferase [Candidatus Bathyarchaeota archaeon]
MVVTVSFSATRYYTSESLRYAGESLLEAPYLLRPFRPDDLSSVVEINRVCLPENYSAYFFMEVFKSCPEAFIVAERESRVVGYIMCRLEFGFSDVRRFRMVRKGHIVSVAVLPEYRRQGIGRELVTSATKALDRHQPAARKIILLSVPAVLAAEESDPQRATVVGM